MNSPVPDHFYDGKVPVFRPTMEQFCDFKSYMESINHFGMDAGILKIIPPKSWRDRLPDLTNKLETIRLKRPIVQHIIGSQGIYTQTNIEKRRSYTINQWHELCHDVYHRPPPFAGEKVSLSTRTPRKKRSQIISHLNESIHAPSVVKPPTISSDTIHVVSTPPRSPNTHIDSHSTRMFKMNNEHKMVLNFEALPTEHIVPQSPPKTPPQGKSNNDINDILINLDDDICGDRKDSFETHHEKLTFDYHCQHPERYDEKYCRELERNYWRNLTFNQPMYGADMSGTLFDEQTSSWNVNNLDNILNRIHINLPGVNTPYLYYGMWKATFAWHVEDMDLYSINYLHFGAPKQWYVIPTAHRQRFERAMQGIFWEDYKKCGQFLRHKTFIVSPTVLANHSIPVHRLVQHEGEFVVTFPFGYHSGYNLGFNCAESVNFAFESWIDIGKVAKSCACIGDSVNIDVSIFEKAVNGKSEADSKYINLDGGLWHQTAQIVQTEKKTYKGTKKRKIEAEITREKLRQYGTSRKIQKSELMQPEPRKCILCPNLGADITTENGKFAHRICAEFIPETMVAIDEETQTNMVFGIFDIPNARKKLKCQICNTANGAGIQCAQPKCYRAYHPTCAKNSSIFIQSTAFEDGSVLYECFCNQHAPRAIVDRTRQKEDMLNQLSQSMTIGRVVYAKWRGGSHYVGTIIEKFEEKQSCRIIFEDGSKSTVLWKNIQLEPSPNEGIAIK